MTTTRRSRTLTIVPEPTDDASDAASSSPELTDQAPGAAKRNRRRGRPRAAATVVLPERQDSPDEPLEVVPDARAGSRTVGGSAPEDTVAVEVIDVVDDLDEHPDLAPDALFPVPDRPDGADLSTPTREVAVDDLLVDLDAPDDEPSAVATVAAATAVDAAPVGANGALTTRGVAAGPVAGPPRSMALVDAPSRRQIRAARRLQARKVGRLVRHIDLFSLFKVSLLFFTCMLLVGVVAGVLLWSALQRSGAVSSIEGFAKEIFLLDEFHIEGRALFRIGVLGGMIGAVLMSLLTVLGGLLFNLISDLTGGIRVSVVELETARPARPRRRR